MCVMSRVYDDVLLKEKKKGMKAVKNKLLNDEIKLMGKMKRT